MNRNKNGRPRAAWWCPFALAAASLALGGCSVTPAGPTPHDLDAALQAAYAGQPVARMLQRYGAPEQQQPYGALTIYTWRRTDWLDFGSGPKPYSCQLDAYVRPDGATVDGVIASGQLGACERYWP